MARALKIKVSYHETEHDESLPGGLRDKGDVIVERTGMLYVQELCVGAYVKTAHDLLEKVVETLNADLARKTGK